MKEKKSNSQENQCCQRKVIKVKINTNGSAGLKAIQVNNPSPQILKPKML